MLLVTSQDQHPSNQWHYLNRAKNIYYFFPLSIHNLLCKPFLLAAQLGKEISAIPPLLLKRRRSERNLQRFSGLNKPRDFHHPSYTLPSRSFTIFIAVLWMLSNSFMFFSYCGTQTLQPALGVRPHSTDRMGHPPLAW